MTELIPVYRSADMNAETDATAIRNMLAKAGLHPELLSDESPGVVEGTWEVHVPAAEAADAEAVIAQVPQDDPGAVDTTHDLDLVTVLRTDGSTAELEALAVHSMLDANGISAVIVGASTLPNLGFEVRVAKDDVARAEAAIAEARAVGPSGAVEAEQSAGTGSQGE